jgi:hypothetical protein
MISVLTLEQQPEQQMSEIPDNYCDNLWLMTDPYLAHLRTTCPKFDDIVVLQ